MAELILHHFDLSPFAEKVRLMFGLKGLTWHSVDIPMVMPKPDLTALTGGYRKTPVLQVGADIYCDTRLIAQELERRYPSPTLYPDGGAGLAQALSAWSDRVFFDPGAGLSMGTNQAFIPAPVLEDRKAFFNFMDFSRLEEDIPHLSTQVLVALDLIEQQLADGRAFLTGPRAGLADIHAYFPVWMLRGNVAMSADWLSGFAKLQSWEARMQAIGHGQRLAITGDEALAISRAGSPASPSAVDTSDPLGLQAEETVQVTPDDYGRVPVVGRLYHLSRQEVAILREDARAGEVVVHFPRAGYRIDRLQG
jgi:glutathione S-transferase